MSEATPVSAGDELAVPRQFPIVGLGASAGGLEALAAFLANTPPDSGMAFVVILHLAPDYESSLAAVLQPHTALPVRQVTRAVTVAPNHVYVIPPAKHIVIEDGRLRLTEPSEDGGRHVPIDRFFRTLAGARGRQAAAVVLSGTGSDGTIGLKQIKEAGGLVCAQDPQDAAFDGMPRSAIATGLVDVVLPAAALPAMLIAFWQRAATLDLAPEAAADDAPAVPAGDTPSASAGGDAPAADDTLREILALLLVRTGHDFSAYKRPTVLRRLARRMQVTGVTELATYLDVLRSRSEEMQALLADLLISVTHFFRDADAWTALAAVMPRLFAAKTARDQVRVWAAGCATGEEAYTVAMLLLEHAATLEQSPSIQVFATDIDEAALGVARHGRYPENIAADVTPERLQRFFVLEEGYYRVKPELRDRVLFAQHNVLRDPPFSNLDLVTCRNLLIYLDRTAQEHVTRVFHFGLRPDGYLLLGSSEALDGLSSLFTAIDKGLRLFQRRPAAPTVLLPLDTPRLRPALERPRAAPRPERADEPSSFGELHRALLEAHLPPSVVVTPEGEIAHLGRGVGRFLRFDEGDPLIVNVIHPDLRLELRTALFTAQQQGRAVTARRLPIALAEGPSAPPGRSEGQRLVDLTVQPITAPEWARGHLLVTFVDVGEADAAAGAPQEAEPLVAQLEAEVARTREQLHTTVEQYEVMVEEHKAANEELQAINEEVRAGAEELETSKEELQSVNEELRTLNEELRHKVEEVTQANNDLQNLIAATAIGTLFLDHELRITRYTPSVVGIFNLIPTDLHRPLSDLTHTLRDDRLVADAQTVLTTLQPIAREVERTTGQWYLVELRPYRTVDDQFAGVVITFVDITARKQAEAALRASEERLRVVVESVQDYAIFTLDPQGRVTSWNAGAHRIKGYTAEEVIGQPVEQFYTPEDIASGLPARELATALREGRSEHETWRVRRDGSRFWGNEVVTPLYADDGTHLGFTKITRDVTARKQAEDAVARALAAEQAARAEAEAALRTRDRFLSVASHELRTPLTSLVGYAHLLPLVAAQGAEAIAPLSERITQQVQRLTTLVGQLLDVSRLERGQFVIDRQLLDLAALVARVTDDFRLGLGAEAARWPIALHSTPDGCPIQGDAVRLEQVIFNLLSNAVKYSPSGGTVAVRVAVEDGWAVLEVQDQGSGIPVDAQPRLFEPFYRADDAGGGGGLGLGLFIVHEIVTRHDGRISVTSADSQGSTFRVSLPLADPPA